jgi:lycopene beta-cyclase
MASPDTGVAILGGGCAGLSLAVRLADAGVDAAVVEPRAGAEADRLWSFWRTGPDPFEDCVRARWTGWRVSHGGAVAPRSSGRLRYETVCAGRFGDKALGLCDRAPSIRLALGTRAEGEPRREGGLWRTETDAGPLLSRYVVDTRPPEGPPGYGQYFVGREIGFSRDAVDPSEVGLMEFAAPRPDRVDFLYVLPFAPDRALLEATTFAPRPPDMGELTAWLERETEARAGGGGREVLREERGYLPMIAPRPGAHTPDLPPRFGLSGVRGGAARPSTGYAFQRIQWMSDVLAARIRAGAEDLALTPDGPGTRFMDRLFLKVLERRPAAGPALFHALFRHAGPDRLERFLSGSRAPLDRLAVMGALPPGPFLKELATP